MMQCYSVMGGQTVEYKQEGIVMIINNKMIGVKDQRPIYIKRIKHYVYQTRNVLGKGNFSKVYAGTNELTNEPVAIKVIQMESIKNPKLLELHQNQRQVLLKLNHPHCIHCLDIINSDHHCYIVTELCSGGDLDIYAKKRGFLTEAQAAPFLRDILEGLIYLAQLNIVHRDLKVANVFLHQNRAKIADFGFAVVSKQKFEDLNIGSPLYMSPEGYIHCMYGPKTDIWAFGILIYELLHGDTPYSHCKLQSDLRRNLSFPFDRTKIKATISGDLREVILRCLQIMQPKRISVFQLRETFYFKRIYQELNPSLYQHLQESASPSSYSFEPIRVKSIDTLYGEEFKRHTLEIPNNRNQVIEQRLEAGHHNQQINKPLPSLRIHHHLHLPQSKDVVRLGRPISTAKRQEGNLSPAVIRGRFGSIDSKKPVQNFAIINASITFKTAINLLHYCRCMYRYAQLLVQANESPKDLKFLSGWLMLVLEEIKRKLNENQIQFQGLNKETKAAKLRQVRADYERKYSDELKHYLTGFINKPTLHEVKTFFFLQYRKYDYLLNKSKGAPYYQVGFFSVLLYDATRLLIKCQEFNDFLRYVNYKDLEQALQWPKERFDEQLFSGIRKRIVLNS